MKIFNNLVEVTSSGYIRFPDGSYYYCKYMEAVNRAVGASGATPTNPDANTAGGYQLNGASEYLYFGGRVCSNWDQVSDLEVYTEWECNVDNSGGGVDDTVDLQLIARIKGVGDTACKTQTIEEATTVGQSAQYKMFSTTFAINYDDGSNPVDVNDILSFRLNLETDTSEVDDIIINFITFRYKVNKVHIETT